MAHGHHIDASEDLAKTFEETGGWLLLPAAGVGVIGLVTAAFLGMSAGWERLAFSYLTAFCYFFSIAAAATIFLMISHVCRAAWLTTVRRLAEYMSAGMWVYGLLFVPLLIVVASESGMVFPWTSQAYVDAHTLVQAKTWWLDVNQFLFRNVLYFAIFALLGRSMLKKSAAMDVEGADAVALAKKLEKNSAWGIPLAALTLTAGAIDWIMTLAPEWYSTIIGVYLFAGGAMGFFAVMSFLAIVLTQSGTLSKAITVEHRHDLGKLAFAFVVFWSYIAFSQYLLIWYADIPEETVWYRVRQMNGWQYVGIALVIGHFVIPFFGLMNKIVKRSSAGLPFWAAWILVFHYVDLVYLIMPQVSDSPTGFGLIDLACMAGVGGCVVAGAAYSAAGTKLVAAGDPRIPEAMAYHNV